MVQASSDFYLILRRIHIPLKDRQENAALADQADVFTHPEEKQ